MPERTVDYPACEVFDRVHTRLDHAEQHDERTYVVPSVFDAEEKNENRRRSAEYSHDPVKIPHLLIFDLHVELVAPQLIGKPYVPTEYGIAVSSSLSRMRNS